MPKEKGPKRPKSKGRLRRPEVAGAEKVLEIVDWKIENTFFGMEGSARSTWEPAARISTPPSSAALFKTRASFGLAVLHLRRHTEKAVCSHASKG